MLHGRKNAVRPAQHGVCRLNFAGVQIFPDAGGAHRCPLLADSFCHQRLHAVLLCELLQQLRISLRNGPNGTVYGSLGYVLIEKARQTGDYTEALAFNMEALDYDEDDAVILDNLGQLHLSMGDKEKALEYFTRAHDIKPKQVDTLYYLALLALDRGEADAAREYLADALSGNYSALCTTTREQAQQLLDSIA